ncbi:MAG TPA: glycosyltransferase family 39 protein, partial [Myxococcota bacterium]|nr:glycosyltransferase family 39 protein [Myxococcota bacterium]
MLRRLGLGSAAPRILGRRAALVLLPALATLLFAVTFEQGMRGTDDLDYADDAIALLGGEGSAPMLPPHHHDARLGVILPLAALFFAVGTSDLSITILPLASTVLTAALIAWLAGRVFGSRVGLAGGLLYALIPMTVDLATVCVPEPVLSLALCAATAFYVLSAEDRHGIA